MWYAVLKQEIPLSDIFGVNDVIAAGSIWSLKKLDVTDETIYCAVYSGNMGNYAPMFLTPEQVKKIFTKQTRSAVEAVQMSDEIAEEFYG